MDYNIDFDSLDNEELIEVLSALEGMNDIIKEMENEKNEGIND